MIHAHYQQERRPSRLRAIMRGALECAVIFIALIGVGVAATIKF